MQVVHYRASPLPAHSTQTPAYDLDVKPNGPMMIYDRVKLHIHLLDSCRLPSEAFKQSNSFSE
jgi:hypothetical protein